MEEKEINNFICVFAAQSLIEFGESLKQMADVKYALDDNIKQNVLEPLHHLQTKDLKEVMVIIVIRRLCRRFLSTGLSD